jgi:mRNA interferase MazF
MKSFQRGQLWLVNFEPSIGHEYQKVRPAVIVQQERYISTGSLLTVIPLSTQLHKTRELDVRIKKSATNRLLKDSLTKTMQISSFDRQRFIKYIGTLNDDVIERIDVNIHQFLFGATCPHATEGSSTSRLSVKKSPSMQAQDEVENEE